MLLFDTSGIEAYVTENNPKYANRIIKQLKAYAKANNFKVNVVFEQSKKLRFVRFINIFTIFKNICQSELFLWYHSIISFRGVIYGF